MTNLFYLAAALKTGDEFSTVVPGDVGQSMLDPRDIADLAAAVLADAVLAEDSGDASPHDGAAYYQTGGAAITFDETAAIMARVLGRTIRYRQMTPQAWADLVAGRGLPDWLVEHQVKMFGFAAAGAFSATTDVTERITGRAPRPLEAFIEENAGAFAKSA